MKKYAVLSMVFNFVAIALFVSGIIGFSAGRTGIGSACVSFGSAFLGLGIFLSRKERSGSGCDKKEG